MRLRPIVVLVVAAALGLCSFAGAAESEPTAATPPKAFTRGHEPLEEGSYRTYVLLGLVETHGIPTRFELQFGPTKHYGRRAYDYEDPIAYNGRAPVAVDCLAQGLRPGTTYHYRLLAWNEAGRSVGKDRTLHTPPRRRAR